MSSIRISLLYLFSLILNGFADPLVGGKPVGKLEKVGNDLVVRSEKKYPYVVHLSFYETTPTEGAEDKQCGGVLIGPQTVLTAAHCIKDMKSNPEIEVSAGRLYMLLEEGQTVPVQKYKIHEDWAKAYAAGKNKVQFNRNDISLLWLEERVAFSSSIQPAVLAGKNSVTRKSGLIFGWGVTENKRPSPMLRMAELKVVTLLNCKAQFPKIVFDDTKLCLISETLTSTLCHGDSGGPFVSNGVVYGIASFGRKTCDPKSPSVFTNVALYEDWIKATVKQWSLKEFKKLKFDRPNVQNERPQTKAPKFVSKKPIKGSKSGSSNPK